MAAILAPPRLHPAQMRRLARQMPPEAMHETVIRPLGGGDAKTLIATAPIDNFVEALFDQLSADDWATTLAAMHGVRRGTDTVLELGLPTHRKAQIALFEVFCRQPGSPRLDPKKIADKGMVIRRVHAGNRWDGWMKGPRAIGGWALLPDADADPGIRGNEAFHAANRAARQQIAARKPKVQFHEEVLPLHIVPPEICALRGRTILFGVIPVVSDERSSAAPPALNYATLAPSSRNPIVGHLSEYLKERPLTPMPRAGDPLRRKWNALDPIAPKPDGTQPPADAGRIQAFGKFLQQLILELDAFGGGPSGNALLAVLRDITLRVRDANKVARNIDAATFAQQAATILIERQPNTGDLIRMPDEWPKIDAALGARLTKAALDCLSARHATLSRSPGKFEVASDQFAVRGFIRVAGHEGCAEKLLWSGPSERFRVLPWWDGDGPGIKIALPDLSQLKRVKPNVAFEMPPALANLLGGDMKKLADGEGSTDGLQIGFLCSFSIPIITLCAFIVLNIFLGLFDLIFRWMLWIKICLPIPTVMPPPPAESDT
uniref:hypothetical protein n=1 Tax=Sphingomonas bacterium TaxID=1895847 RepID=UPI00263050FC|nr:hypothetical protein [Sphingomonas bacterium]